MASKFTTISRSNDDSVLLDVSQKKERDRDDTVSLATAEIDEAARITHLYSWSLNLWRQSHEKRPLREMSGLFNSAP
jgi:hypothetical protein